MVPWAQNSLGLLYMRLGREPEARDILTKAFNADPFNAEAQRKIEEMIQHERIQENIQKALEENPECELDTRACERWLICSLPCICLVS